MLAEAGGLGTAEAEGSEAAEAEVRFPREAVSKSVSYVSFFCRCLDRLMESLATMLTHTNKH